MLVRGIYSQTPEKITVLTLSLCSNHRRMYCKIAPFTFG